MNRNSSLLSLAALAMASSIAAPITSYGITISPFSDWGPVPDSLKHVNQWGSGAGYYKRPKDKATIKRRKKNKAARKARK